MRNGRRSKALALREAGYSAAITRQPHKVFGSKAVRMELEFRGHGPDGIRNNLAPRPVELIQQTETTPARMDFSRVSKETLQDLKEKLDSID